MLFRKFKNQLILGGGLLICSMASMAFNGNANPEVLSTELSKKEMKKKSSLPQETSDVLKELNRVSFSGAEMSFKNVVEDYPELSTTYKSHLVNLKKFEKRFTGLVSLVEQNNTAAIKEAKLFLTEHRAALLQNPILKNKEIYAVRQIVEKSRDAMAAQIGRNQNNWTTNATIKRSGWNNEICKLSNLSGEVNLTTIFKTENGVPIKDIDLNWNGEKMIFSSVGANNRWHVYEFEPGGAKPKRLTPSDKTDIDFFDACYLPDGRIILASTASYVGVPCIGGGQPASDLYLLDREKDKIRQLNFGQDCDWNPVILNNGKVCYLRWEYTDNSHYFTRILMNMNPDGTAKKEYYGSGSYFPNSLFDARPIPNHSSQFVGVVSGHHGIARSGRLLIFDPSKGRKETDGVIQEIPGYGKVVEPIVKDQLVNGVWPQFLTPFPLNEDYFLVSAKMSPKEFWGIYLVDRFDNMTLIYNKEGEAFAEPFVAEKRPVPPVIPDRVDENSTTSTVYITDIYEGQGLKGIPRGTVKKLRIYAYQYGYNKVGGHDLIGLEAGWDVKRILGTVPVEKDGSTMFTIPANTPISMQPLDEHGSALQLMRSWMTGMPGEVVSCVGCHESQNTVPPSKFTLASRKRPETITPWYGPARPVTYNNELKPTIDKNCVGCHDGSNQKVPDFSSDEDSKYHGFSKSYMALHPYIRRPGCESDFYTLEPMDYYSNTSELVQMLRKGHHGVELNDEEWDRLITWIDMNVPYRGSYESRTYEGFDQVTRREELLNYFGNVSLYGERELARADSMRIANGPITPVFPEAKEKSKVKDVSVKGWPLRKKTAVKLQQEFAVDGGITKTVQLKSGINLEFARIPAGHFVIGDNNGQPDQKESVVEIDEPFWMLKTEITNEMFRTIFADHDSRHIDQQWKDHIFPGYKANLDQQPVIRVTWNQAQEFCAELSKQTGLNINLPTEAQWEWAARSGRDSEMYFGDVSDDFSNYENLADHTLRDLAVVGVDPKPMKTKDKRFEFYNFVPKVEKYDDGVLVPEGTAMYKPNVWGLYDMLGNVAEWTSTAYSYDGYNGEPESDLKVAKGGSWRDRPKFATTAARDGYLPYQKVFNVGFRIVINEPEVMVNK
jgi:formylglycine-generating enzyme required for sulfatase activity